MIILIKTWLFLSPARSCGPPGELPHGWVTAECHTFGCRAALHCGAGFELVGKAERFCQPDGTWAPNELPTCVRKWHKHITLLSVLFTLFPSLILSWFKQSLPCDLDVQITYPFYPFSSFWFSQLRSLIFFLVFLKSL